MHHHQRRNRRGVALVLVAMMLMAVMALAALAIDMSLVQLTRRQMQGAVNTAALEALRNGAQPASDLVAEQIFADPSGQQIAYGAGPYIPYSGGIAMDGSNYMASQYLPLPTPGSGAQPNGSTISGPWLPPQLAYQATTNQGGDFVAGQYQGDSASHVEDSSYNRGDFTPQSSSLNSTPPNSMLVRMRRSTEYTNGTLPAGAHRRAAGAVFIRPRQPAHAVWRQSVARRRGYGPSNRDRRVDSGDRDQGLESE